MKIYKVGGAVRDRLLSFQYHETDWVVIGSSPEEMINLGFTPVGRDFPVFLHPKTKEEYALARTEKKISVGHQGFEFYTDPEITLEEDLGRRDLTINAIAEDSKGVLIDPYGGVKDVEDKILRHVSDAFIEDPLRVFRVARFYARYQHLGFKIAEATKTLMIDIVDSGEILTLSNERIWSEIESAMREIAPHSFFSCLLETRALREIIPEVFQKMSENSENKEKSLALMKSVAAEINEIELRFASLFWSLLPELEYKPDLIKTIFKRLKAPNKFTEVATLFYRNIERAWISPYLDPPSIISMTKEMGILKNSELFDVLLRFFVKVWQVENKNSAEIERTESFLKSVHKELNKIKIDDFEISNLSGREIGKKLEKAQTKIIIELQKAS